MIERSTASWPKRTLHVLPLLVGPIALGIVLSAAPAGLFELCLLVLVPICIYLEWRRRRKNPASNRTWLRVLTVVAVVGVAALAPLKYEDRVVDMSAADFRSDGYIAWLTS